MALSINDAASGQIAIVKATANTAALVSGPLRLYAVGMDAGGVGTVTVYNGTATSGTSMIVLTTTAEKESEFWHFGPPGVAMDAISVTMTVGEAYFFYRTE